MLVEPNPNLPNDDLVDDKVLKAVRSFRIQWGRRVGFSTLDNGNLNVISVGLFAMIGRALGKDRILKELRETDDYQIRSLLLGMDTVGFIETCYTPQMEACDEKIVSIFGGKNAVAAANSFDPDGLAVVRYFVDGSYSYYRGDMIQVNVGNINPGRLSSHSMHLYGSTDGTRFGVDGNTFTDLYVPDGFENPEKVRKVVSPTQACVDFYYKKLGNAEDITLVICHIKDFKLKREGDRWHIGQIGGKGGHTLNYIHSHFRLNKGNVGLTDKGEIRVGFSEVFC